MGTYFFLFLVILKIFLVSSTSTTTTLPLTVTVNVTTIINEVSPLYVSANFDWHTDAEEFPAWVNSSAMVIDLDNINLRALAAAFAPSHLRVGGSEGDCIIVDLSGNDCNTLLPKTQAFCVNNSIGYPNAFCLSTSKWN